MEDRTFSTNNHPTNGISDTFCEFIEALVEEVALKGEPFDAQKKWLHKHSEAESLNYKTIENNLNDLFEAIKELEEHESKVIERSVRALAKECYLSEAEVDKLVDNAAEIRSQKKENRNDFMIVCFDNGERYEGNWKDGLRSGHGVLFWTDGDRYEGNWEDDHINGQGTFYWANSGDRYEGNWKDGKMNGQGIMFYADGSKYEGGWKDNNKHGQGSMYWSDCGHSYNGNWQDNKKHGPGKYYWPNGDRFEGNWSNNVINGPGKYYWPDGDRLEGNWENGRRNGPGTVFWNSGIKDSGNFINDKRDGEWLRIKTDGKQLKATYKNGEIVIDWH